LVRAKKIAAIGVEDGIAGAVHQNPTTRTTANDKSSTDQPEAAKLQPVSKSETTVANDNRSNAKLLAVPFTSQAPTANWDTLHNEACEEASAIMAAAYFSGDTRSILPADEVEADLIALAQWSIKTFGSSLDIATEETAKMLRDVYQLNAEVRHNLSENELKQLIAENKLVIMPINGQRIGNPHYRQPGPLYHMLLVRGCTETRIVTNDSGTKFSENHSYTLKKLTNALVDWSHEKDTVMPATGVTVVWK